MRIILCYLSLLFAVGCKSTSSISDQTETLLFSIEKGACFGACPQYKVEVYSDGSAYYYGSRNVDKIGEYKVQLSDAFTKQIKKELSNSNIEKLDSSYVNNYLTDFPAIDLCFDLNPKKKCIHVFHQEPPQEINDLLRLIEGFEKGIDWKNTN